MGPIPALHAGINDEQKLLTKRQLSTVKAALLTFHSDFPQVRFHMVSQPFKTDFPIEAKLFWLINTAAFSSKNTRLGKNFDILFGIDVTTGQAGLVVGYGLESYLTPKTLKSILSLALPHLESDRTDEALLIMLDSLREILVSAGPVLEKTQQESDASYPAHY